MFSKYPGLRTVFHIKDFKKFLDSLMNFFHKVPMFAQWFKHIDFTKKSPKSVDQNMPGNFQWIMKNCPKTCFQPESLTTTTKSLHRHKSFISEGHSFTRLVKEIKFVIGLLRGSLDVCPMTFFVSTLLSDFFVKTLFVAFWNNFATFCLWFPKKPLASFFFVFFWKKVSF